MNLKIGNYKNNQDGPKEYDFSNPPVETPPVDAIPPQEVNTPPVETPPAGIDTQIPPTESNNNNNPPVNTPPAEPNSLNTDNTPTTITPPPVDVAVSEEVMLKTLSEKLGREITSLDELTPTPTDPYGGDEKLKEIAEWRAKTNRPFEDYFK